MNEEQTKSTFVTVVAWIFIILSGFMTMISILQNIMYSLIFDNNEISHTAEEMPAAARFLFGHFQVLLVVMLCIVTVTFVSSIGLLKRREWARKIFIAILVMGIVWNLASLFFSHSMMNEMPERIEMQGDAGFQAMKRIMTIFTTVISLGISCAFGWIAFRLSSENIRREFKAS